MTNPIRLIFAALISITGCSTSTTQRLNLPELPVVEHVDVERYLGTWYEIASFPQSFQEGCTATTATYKLRDDGQLDVINRCRKGGLNGEEDVAEGRARIVDTKTNAKLEVSFFRPFWGDYWIIDLADDYSYAVVGHPDRDYLWILSRTQQLDSAVYDGILERLKLNGYELERLNKTLQPETTKPAEAVKEELELPPTSALAADTLAGQLAQRVLEADLAQQPQAILDALKLPTPETFPRRPTTGVFKVAIDSPEGPLSLSMILMKGTWEQPKGNSAPKADPAKVEGIELSAANGLNIDIPIEAKTLVFDGDSVRRFQVWGDGSYFEQGTDGKGWTVAKYTGRAPFHTTAADRKAMEDAMILVTDKILAGQKDLQIFAASEFADKKISENLYDFGAGTLHFVYPTAMAAKWNGPTQIPRFFEKLKVRMIETSFANDAGQMVKAIDLKSFTIRPSRYFFVDPDAQENEMGMAAEAKFRALTVQMPNP